LEERKVRLPLSRSTWTWGSLQERVGGGRRRFRVVARGGAQSKGSKKRGLPSPQSIERTADHMWGGRKYEGAGRKLPQLRVKRILHVAFPPREMPLGGVLLTKKSKVGFRGGQRKYGKNRARGKRVLVRNRGDEEEGLRVSWHLHFAGSEKLT